MTQNPKSAVEPAAPAPEDAPGWSICRAGKFGDFAAFDMPAGTDMILVCVNTYAHKPVTVLLPHQLYIEKIEQLLIEHGAREITVMPYRNAHKVTITQADLRAAVAKAADQAGRP